MAIGSVTMGAPKKVYYHKSGTVGAPSLGWSFSDVVDAGKSIFEEWISGKGKTEEKELLKAQIEAQKAQTERITTLLTIGLVGVAVVMGLKAAR